MYFTFFKALQICSIDHKTFKVRNSYHVDVASYRKLLNILYIKKDSFLLSLCFRQGLVT